jgi:inner membrane protein
MDSLTQIALGSAVSVAVMGRRTALWKAALWGAIAGTLPDLDVVIDHGNPVLNMVRHRAESHSLFYLTLFAPLLALVAAKLHGEMALFKRWWLAIWLVLVTHPLLDNMTVYGTQLLMPFTDHPFAIGSVFIIDPAYTLPLVIGVVAALRLKNDRGLKWNAVALALSTAYLAWGVLAQYHVTTIARAAMPAPDIAADNLLVTPTPFNSVLWRLVATTPDQYFEGYYSLLDPEPTVRWTAHPRGAELISQHGEVDAVARIAAFSQGFFKMQTSANPGQVLLTDLRMGQEPSYTFSFDLGKPGEVGTAPIQQRRMRADLGEALPWLWQRLLGRTLTSLAVPNA